MILYHKFNCTFLNIVLKSQIHKTFLRNKHAIFSSHGKYWVPNYEYVFKMVLNLCVCNVSKLWITNLNAIETNFYSYECPFMVTNRFKKLSFSQIEL